MSAVLTYVLHVLVEKKPVRFPRTPSFNDILKMLEENNRKKKLGNLVQKAEGRIDDSSLPEIKLDSFF